MNLSECLRLRLRADPRSLGQLALRTGIPKQTLSAWLGGRKPSGDTIDRAYALARAEHWDLADCVSRSRDETAAA